MISRISTPRQSRRSFGPTLRQSAVLGGLAALSLGLAACGEFNVRREIGLVGNGPDEFRVIKQGALEIPADTATLPMPKPGAPSRVEPNPSLDAQRALAGGAIITASTQSPAEAALLRAAGADSVSPEIRKQIAEDEAAAEENTRLLDGLFGGSKPGETPLDQAEEARRLAEAARASKNPGLEVPPPPTQQ